MAGISQPGRCADPCRRKYVHRSCPHRRLQPWAPLLARRQSGTPRTVRQRRKRQSSSERSSPRACSDVRCHWLSRMPDAVTSATRRGASVAHNADGRSAAESRDPQRVYRHNGGRQYRGSGCMHSRRGRARALPRAAQAERGHTTRVSVPSECTGCALGAGVKRRRSVLSCTTVASHRRRAQVCPTPREGC